MSKAETQAPPEVVTAVETLERATSATDLGQAYKTVLDWRGSGPRWTFGARLYQVASIIAIIASVFLLRYVSFEVPDYWRGFLFGALVISRYYEHPGLVVAAVADKDDVP